MITLNETGDAAEGPTTAFTLSDFGEIFGEINSGDDVDWYRVQINDAIGYNVVAYGRRDGTFNGLDSGRFQLLDARTEIVSDEASSGPNAAILNAPNTSSAAIPDEERYDFYFSVAGIRDETGRYRISVERDEAANELTAARITPAARYEGVVNYRGSGFFDGDSDWIAADLDANTGYHFRLVYENGLTSTTGNNFHILNGDGEEVSSGDEEFRAYVQPSASGTYFARVSNNEPYRTGQSENYFVEMFEDIPGDTQSREAIDLGVEKDGFLFPDFFDRDAYRATLEAGMEYTISLRGFNAFNIGDSYEIKVLDSEGSELAVRESGFNTDIELAFTPQSEGEYLILAGGRDTDYDSALDPQGSFDYSIWFGPTDATYGQGSDDELIGTDQGDQFFGLSGSDRILGLDGSDTLDGGLGTDTLNGGAGNDVIRGGGSENDLRDLIFGGLGDDDLDGGYGNDQIFGQEGSDTLAGGFGADELQGQEGDDVITGGALSDLVYGGTGNDFVNGGFGYDRINGGDGGDRFFHLGVADHGSDWVQDYDAAEGDVLVFGQAATADQFQINLAHTATSDGERSGDDAAQEAFVIYRPTGQIMWALVDGEDQSSINLQIGGEVFDLMV